MAELYTLPDGWEWKKLDLVCKFIRGPFGGSLKKQIFKDSGNAVYEQSHAIYNQFEQIRYFIDDEKFEEMKRFELVPNSLIMSCSGTIGKVAIVPNNVKKGIINQALLMLITNEKLNNIFLKLLMESNFFQNLLSENSTGAAISNVASVKVLKEIQIPLPPLEEQKRIVAKLDNLFAKIDKAIALHQKNIDEANVFMASVLNDVFVELEEKYEKKQLNEIIKIIGGGTPSKANKEYWENGTIKWATVGDMNVETITKTELSITEIGLKNSSSNIIPKNGIIIATRVGLGKVCYLEDDIAINQDLKGLIPKDDKLNIRYLFNFFKNIEKYILSNGTGATVKGVKLEFIKELELPLPPLETQQKVVSYLDEISQKMEKIKQIQKEKMQSLKALKASILDQAFKGEL